VARAPALDGTIKCGRSIVRGQNKIDMHDEFEEMATTTPTRIERTTRDTNSANYIL